MEVVGDAEDVVEVVFGEFFDDEVGDVVGET